MSLQSSQTHADESKKTQISEPAVVAEGKNDSQRNVAPQPVPCHSYPPANDPVSAAH